jgi:hypothetical protein
VCNWSEIVQLEHVISLDIVVEVDRNSRNKDGFEDGEEDWLI